MFRRILITLVVVASVAAIVILRGKNNAAAADAEIKWIRVQRGNIVEKALAIGRIVPRKEISVKSKISGLVKAVSVEVGDTVRPGQPLIEIKPDPTPLEFAEAKRNVEIAEVGASNASIEFERTKELLAAKIVPQREFDQAEKARKELDLKLSLAREQFALIELGRTEIAGRMIDTVIKAPVEGTILERRVNEGDPVVPLTSYQAGTELFLMADMSRLIFKGTVDEIDVGKLVEGMSADLKIGAIPDEKIVGRLTRISPKAKQQENATLFDVEIEILERGGRVIRAGYSANADVVIRQAQNALFIPERLVEFRDGKAFVEIRNANGRTEKKEIEVGLSDRISIEVKTGLKDGDEIAERPPKEVK